jgi:hypothetical protein
VKRIVIFLVAAALIAVGLIALLNAFNYSVGTRTGTLDKLSSKGITCWTTEGQLALRAFSRTGTLRANNQTIDNTFYFSVPDRDVRKALDAIPAGSPVSLEYRQKLFALAWPVPFLCIRRTQYEVVGVRLAPALPMDNDVPLRP